MTTIFLLFCPSSTLDDIISLLFSFCELFIPLSSYSSLSLFNSWFHTLTTVSCPTLHVTIFQSFCLFPLPIPFSFSFFFFFLLPPREAILLSSFLMSLTGGVAFHATLDFARFHRLILNINGLHNNLFGELLFIGS